MIQYSGLWLLVALAFNMWALLSVLRSGRRPSVMGLWVAALVLLPVVGFVAWFLIGPREAHA